jgi:hypothetical protein
MKRISATATIALLLWGTTALSSLTRAQDKIEDARATGVTLDSASLETMLTGLGFEPKSLSKGYLIAVKRDTWTFNMQLVLSGDGTKLGFNANLGTVPDPDAVTAIQWRTLMADNADIDPSSFYFDRDQKKIYLHRVLDNRAITAAYLRKSVDNFCDNIKNTAADWAFTK